ERPALAAQGDGGARGAAARSGPIQGTGHPGLSSSRGGAASLLPQTLPPYRSSADGRAPSLAALQRVMIAVSFWAPSERVLGMSSRFPMSALAATSEKVAWISGHCLK